MWRPIAPSGACASARKKELGDADKWPDLVRDPVAARRMIQAEGDRGCRDVPGPRIVPARSADKSSTVDAALRRVRTVAAYRNSVLAVVASCVIEPHYAPPTLLRRPALLQDRGGADAVHVFALNATPVQSARHAREAGGCPVIR